MQSRESTRQAALDSEHHNTIHPNSIKSTISRRAGTWSLFHIISFLWLHGGPWQRYSNTSNSPRENFKPGTEVGQGLQGALKGAWHPVAFFGILWPEVEISLQTGISYKAAQAYVSGRAEYERFVVMDSMDLEWQDALSRTFQGPWRSAEYLDCFYTQCVPDPRLLAVCCP